MASDQLAYAPVRPEGDTAQERDDFRLPRQRSNALAAQGAPGATATPAFAAFAHAGAAGLAPAPTVEPAARPAKIPLPDAVPGGGASLAGVPAYDPTALTAPSAFSTSAAAPVADAASTALLTRPVVDPEPVEVAEVAEVADTTGTVAEPVDPGTALCARILGQATAQREAAARAEREAAERAAAEQAAREAAERKVREQVAAAKAAAEEKAREEAAAAARAEAERLALLAASYIKPVACATLGAGFGETDPWANLHNGQDFTAPTGTPVHAVHGGTVTSAGWAGSDGYRVVLTLDDGTELRYCHLSTMVVTEGRVTTGDTIGRVGATGNVPAPHLHLEVRPDGGAPVDPLPWLRAHDVTV
ncbi:Peptidase family M23 [Actinacidiphila yanglinensis]|uniref:Peptidase family M23 n=1 Tax=Actinacidiphila yanglinensis TaxID=310779 RepID=A0A1H5YUJ4_9ACTN|nr:M23 family metallopeptidase [Actinacidiphila yanglinensis]SEG27470.1 Peptidase family M23 [Actinacidiphila yanglinensis]